MFHFANALKFFYFERLVVIAVSGSHFGQPVVFDGTSRLLAKEKASHVDLLALLGVG